MPSQLVIAPLLIALITAVFTLFVRRFSRIQRAISLGGAFVYLGAVILLASSVMDQSILVYQLSGWPAPFGITLVADALSVFMLGLTAVVSLAAIAFSTRFMSEYAQRVSYHSLYHMMIVGITGSFLTGDVFNLFVWFEVLLLSSYVLVGFYSGPEHTRAALQYTILNLLGSAVMLLAIGGLYATTGTLNMADMARRLGNPGQFGIDVIPVLGLAALLFAVFALKTGIVPFHFWVPAAYRAAPAPVAAMLAGVVKKVGVYVIIRLYFTVFAAATLPDGLLLPGFIGRSFLGFFGPVMFIMAVASILLGSVGAISRLDLDGLLAYSSISQIGFIVLPLAVAATVPEVRTLGITATLIYILNHGLAKSMLFMASGTVQDAVGSLQFNDLGGLAKRTPILSGSVFVGMFTLVGIPPLAGFFAKLYVFRTTTIASVIGGRGAVLALAVALGGSILTIAYVTRAWNRGFWGVQPEIVRTATYSPILITIVSGLAASLFFVGVGFEFVLSAAETAAEAALTREEYVTAVLENGY